MQKRPQMKCKKLFFFTLISIFQPLPLDGFQEEKQTNHYSILKDFLKKYPVDQNLTSLDTSRKTQIKFDPHKYDDLLDIQVKSIYVNSFSLAHNHPLNQIKKTVYNFVQDLEEIPYTTSFYKKAIKVTQSAQKKIFTNINDLCDEILKKDSFTQTRIIHGPFPALIKNVGKQLTLPFYDTLLHKKNIKQKKKSQVFFSEKKRLFFIIKKNKKICPATIFSDEEDNYDYLVLGKFLNEEIEKIIDLTYNETSKTGAILYRSKMGYSIDLFTLKKNDENESESELEGETVLTINEKPKKIIRANNSEQFALAFTNTLCVYNKKNNQEIYCEKFSIPSKKIKKIEYKINNSCVLITYKDGSFFIIKLIDQENIIPKDTVAIAESYNGKFAAIATPKSFSLYKILHEKDTIMLQLSHTKNIKKSSIKNILCGSRRMSNKNQEMLEIPVAIVYKNNQKLHKYSTNTCDVLQREQKSLAPEPITDLAANHNCSLVAMMNRNNNKIIRTWITKKPIWSALFLKENTTQEIAFCSNKLLITHPHKSVIRGRKDQISFVTYLYLRLLEKSGGSFKFSKKLKNDGTIQNKSWLEFYQEKANKELRKLKHPNLIKIQPDEKTEGTYNMYFIENVR